MNALLTGRIQKRKTNPLHHSHLACNTRPVHTKGSPPFSSMNSTLRGPLQEGEDSRRCPQLTAQSSRIPATRSNLATLTDDMHVADLIEVLAALRFHAESRCLVSLDRGVRDYLLRNHQAMTGRRFPPPWLVRNFYSEKSRRL
jgi:hypothetical protein